MLTVSISHGEIANGARLRLHVPQKAVSALLLKIFAYRSMLSSLKDNSPVSIPV